MPSHAGQLTSVPTSFGLGRFIQCNRTAPLPFLRPLPSVFQSRGGQCEKIGGGFWECQQRGARSRLGKKGVGIGGTVQAAELDCSDPI